MSSFPRLIDHGQIVAFSAPLARFVSYLPGYRANGKDPIDEGKERSGHRGMIRALLLSQMHFKTVTMKPGARHTYIDKDGNRYFAQNYADWQREDFQWVDSLHTLRDHIIALRDAGFLLVCPESELVPECDRDYIARAQRVAIALNYKALKEALDASEEFCGLAEVVFSFSAAGDPKQPPRTPQPPAPAPKPAGPTPQPATPDPEHRGSVPVGEASLSISNQVDKPEHHQQINPASHPINTRNQGLQHDSKNGMSQGVQRVVSSQQIHQAPTRMEIENAYLALNAIGIKPNNVALQLAQNPTLATAWITYVKSSSRKDNPAGYVRSGIESGKMPPAPRGFKTQRR